MKVYQIWGCEWKERLATDPHLRSMDAEAKDSVPGPLDLRKHALYGGRVEAFQLLTDVTDDQELVALDIVCFPFLREIFFLL